MNAPQKIDQDIPEEKIPTEDRILQFIEKGNDKQAKETAVAAMEFMMSAVNGETKSNPLSEETQRNIMRQIVRWFALCNLDVSEMTLMVQNLTVQLPLSGSAEEWMRVYLEDEDRQYFEKDNPTLNFRKHILRARIKRVMGTADLWFPTLLAQETALMNRDNELFTANQQTLERIARDVIEIEKTMRSCLGQRYGIPDFDYQKALHIVLDPERKFWDQVKEECQKAQQ